MLENIRSMQYWCFYRKDFYFGTSWCSEAVLPSLLNGKQHKPVVEVLTYLHSCDIVQFFWVGPHFHTVSIITDVCQKHEREERVIICTRSIIETKTSVNIQYSLSQIRSQIDNIWIYYIVLHYIHTSFEFLKWLSKSYSSSYLIYVCVCFDSASCFWANWSLLSTRFHVSWSLLFIYIYIYLLYCLLT